MSIDKKLLDYVVEKVCEHKFARLIEDLRKVDYESSIVTECNYCHLPENNKRCRRCRSSWCGREYYCPRPLDNRGVVEYCCGAFICLYCYHKCSIPECKEIGCYGGDTCNKMRSCSNCMKIFCLDHLFYTPLSGIIICKKCSK